MSHVKQRGAFIFLPRIFLGRRIGMIVQGWGRSLETSVNNLSCACFIRRTECPSGAVPVFGRASMLGIGHKAITGIPLAVASPPPLHDIW
jgi:hypothetical protein